MPTIIKADEVCFAPDDDFLLVAFRDSRAAPEQYLMLQRTRAVDAQDLELGMEDVYVERNDQRWSAYGGIRSVLLSRDRLVLEFDDRTTAKLGSHNVIEVHFDLDDARFKAIQDGVAQVFEGRDVLQLP
jgi:hypothetical protein